LDYHPENWLAADLRIEGIGHRQSGIVDRARRRYRQHLSLAFG